jgi:hypothetical protein
VRLEIDPAGVRFVGDRQGHLGFAFSGDRRVDVFCEWLVTDFQNDPPGIVAVADALGRRLAGRGGEEAGGDRAEEFDGNAWHAVVAADAVEAACLYSDARARLSSSDAAVIVHRYWEATRAQWRPERFDRSAARFVRRAGRAPVLPWELDGWTL